MSIYHIVNGKGDHQLEDHPEDAAPLKRGYVVKCACCASTSITALIVYRPQDWRRPIALTLASHLYSVEASCSQMFIDRAAFSALRGGLTQQSIQA